MSVNLVWALARQPGLELHVVTSDQEIGNAEIHTLVAPVGVSPSDLASSRRPPSSQSAGGSFCVHRLPAPRSSLLRYSVGVGRRQVEELLGQLKPDVVHAHDFYGLMTQRLTTPCVFTIHGFIHEDTRYASGWAAWMRSWLWRHYELACWRDQAHIISISPYVRERLRGVATGVIHDIENPIAPEGFEITRTERNGVIFCAASVCERKNTLGLVRAVHHLNRQGLQVELRWAGPIAEAAYRREVGAYVAAHKLERCITFLGDLRAEQVRLELARASVFALVSFEEGAPMGIAEAMAAGVPVVASNRCGMPYMVRDGESGFLVDPDEPQEIAERLGQLLTDPGLRLVMAQCTRAFAWERFHPSLVAERTLRVYRATIESVAALPARSHDRVEKTPLATAGPADPPAAERHATS